MKKIAVLATYIFTAFCFSSETMDLFYETAQSCDDILCIRKEIDQINKELLILLAKRTAYVQRAGDLKAHTIKIAQDLERVKNQENMIIDQALEIGLPLEIALATFRSLVNSSVEFQQKYINQITDQTN